VKQPRAIAVLALTLATAAVGAAAQPAPAPKAPPPKTSASAPGAAIGRAQSLPQVPLTVGTAKLQAEVAATPGQREIGLMHRFSLAPDHGMIFVFPAPEPLGFWMRNTYIALSIAYLDANGVILNIEDMAPQDDTTHWSRGPAQYALEMRKGWFGERGVRAGDRVQGLPKPGPQ
jgi:uncharacterized membrane protein (UPF0127 family)